MSDTTQNSTEEELADLFGDPAPEAHQLPIADIVGVDDPEGFIDLLKTLKD